MRSSHRRAIPVSRPETRLKQAGLEGAKAISRLLVALIENLGVHDKAGLRHEPGWPKGTRLSAFGPTPFGAEIAQAAARVAAPQNLWIDPVADDMSDHYAWTQPGPSAAPEPPPPAREAPAPEPVADISEQVADETFWHRPFDPKPGVRYVRTPDHVLRKYRGIDSPMSPIEPDEAVEPEDEEDGLLLSGSGMTVEEHNEDMDEAGLLGIEDQVSSFQGAPQRVRMFNGVPVALPKAANDPHAMSRVAAKPSFAISVRAKAKTPAPDPVVVAPKAVTRAEPKIERPKSVAPRSRRSAPTIEWDFPAAEILGEPRKPEGNALTAEMLEQNARLLETTLEDFGIRGEIIHVRAGPVVTLYELEPAPGMKSSRVIGLADDIARSMSALSARVAVVPGRNAIGIELPNERRETVYFREMVESDVFVSSEARLAIALGKTIGGEPVIADLAKMPHLLVAGTTGSGKSVAINTMILSLLYRLKPEQCRLIMVDPKMLELSVYDGIPHLLTPVVTDPKKAVVALKWAVREMEDRYKKMSKVGVRNIDGFNRRVKEAAHIGETIMVPVTTGFDRDTGKPIVEDQPLDLKPLPYIVVIVDEMADLMMVAGKDIEGAIQRLAQMARAAGIHLIMATQRPSVDVITGTIKANFPTRISFQVTSKIDSRTILGEMGAEQLLGQGDMLHMQGGGRIYRVHGPFVSDQDVESVVAHLKAQGTPDYLDSVTDEIESDAAEDEDAEDGAVFDKSAMGAEDDGDLYDQAVKIVLRDKKSSISYVQRRLSVGYNKAASLIERMEKEGVLGPASHTGKREILAHSRGRIITGVPVSDED